MLQYKRGSEGTPGEWDTTERLWNPDMRVRATDSGAQLTFQNVASVMQVGRSGEGAPGHGTPGGYGT